MDRSLSSSSGLSVLALYRLPRGGGHRRVAKIGGVDPAAVVEVDPARALAQLADLVEGFLQALPGAEYTDLLVHQQAQPGPDIILALRPSRLEHVLKAGPLFFSPRDRRIRNGAPPRRPPRGLTAGDRAPRQALGGGVGAQAVGAVQRHAGDLACGPDAVCHLTVDVA